MHWKQACRLHLRTHVPLTPWRWLCHVCGGCATSALPCLTGQVRVTEALPLRPPVSNLVGPKADASTCHSLKPYSLHYGTVGGLAVSLLVY